MKFILERNTKATQQKTSCSAIASRSTEAIASFANNNDVTPSSSPFGSPTDGNTLYEYDAQDILQSPFICEYCELEFHSTSSLETHQQIKHAHLLITQPSFACEMCSGLFATKYNLNRHVRERHSETSRYTCGICGQTFSRKQSLKRHSPMHELTKRPFVCSHCPKSYLQKQSLDIHVALKHLQTVMDRHSCFLCAKSYQSAWKHLKTHNIENLPMACVQCGKKFTSKESIIRHLGLRGFRNIFKV